MQDASDVVLWNGIAVGHYAEICVRLRLESQCDFGFAVFQVEIEAGLCLFFSHFANFRRAKISRGFDASGGGDTGSTRLCPENSLTRVEKFFINWRITFLVIRIFIIYQTPVCLFMLQNR